MFATSAYRLVTFLGLRHIFGRQVMDIKVLGVVNADSVLQKATFAGGCFWGLELAFQRAKGVVSTKVGSASLHHGITPTRVCSNSKR